MFSLTLFSQSKFPRGIKLPNAVQRTTVDKIPLMRFGTNKINYWISPTDFKLALGLETPDLQAVTDVGGTTTNSISANNLSASLGSIYQTFLNGANVSITDFSTSTVYGFNTSGLVASKATDILEINFPKDDIFDSGEGTKKLWFPYKADTLAVLGDIKLNLQNVTDEGNITTNNITVQDLTITPANPPFQPNPITRIKKSEITPLRIEVSDTRTESTNNDFVNFLDSEQGLQIQSPTMGGTTTVTLNSQFNLSRAGNSFVNISELLFRIGLNGDTRNTLSRNNQTYYSGNGNSFQIQPPQSGWISNYQVRFQPKSGDIALTNDIPQIQAGTNVTIDNTDPLNPIINTSGGAGGSTYSNGLNLSTNNVKLGGELTEASTELTITDDIKSFSVFAGTSVPQLNTGIQVKGQELLLQAPSIGLDSIQINGRVKLKNFIDFRNGGSSTNMYFGTGYGAAQPEDIFIASTPTEPMIITVGDDAAYDVTLKDNVFTSDDAVVNKKYVDDSHPIKSNFYQESAFTPQLKAGTQTYTVNGLNQGYYVRTGNQVTVSIRLTSIADALDITGNLNIDLPLPANTNGQEGNIIIQQVNATGFNSAYSISTRLSSTSILLRNPTTQSNLTNFSFSGGSIYISGTYITNVYTP